MTAHEHIASLHRKRPVSRLLRWSIAFGVVLVIWAWWAGDFSVADLFSDRRMANLRRFVTVDIIPQAADGRRLPVGEWGGWAAELLSEHGREAIVTTLAISIAAIVLAWIGSIVLCLPAARTFMRAEPFGHASATRNRKLDLAWRTAAALVRALLILLRSVPEYVLTFLLISLLGVSAWPAVLALAIHNTGILGKLNAEVVENLEEHRLSTLRLAGASRLQVAAVGVYPSALSRFLLYFFYRWETCVREATVLGMLGIVSLGRLVDDAGVARAEDQLVFYVLIGAGLVLVGDLLSAFARHLVRKAR